MSIIHGDIHLEDLVGGGITKPYNVVEPVSAAELKGKTIQMIGKLRFPNSDKKRNAAELAADYKSVGVPLDKKLPLLGDTMSKDDGIVNFIELRDLNTDKPKPDMSIVGNKALDFYMEGQRLKTKNEQGKSQHEMWQNLNTRKRLYEDTYALKKGVLAAEGVYRPDELRKENIFGRLLDRHIRGGLQMSVNAVNQFKPSVAKWLYSRFKATSVIDFSAGWGGRMLGAMSLDIPYVGVDTNTSIRPQYEQIMKVYQPYTKSKTSIYFQKGEDFNFSQFTYDCVLTSPPYIADGLSKTGKTKQIEDYEGMPDYDTDAFYEAFLKPTIFRAFINLQRGGVFLLNTNQKNYLGLIKRGIIPECQLQIVYPTRARAGEKKRLDTGVSEREYKEFIYVWFNNPKTSQKFKTLNKGIVVGRNTNVAPLTSTGTLDKTPAELRTIKNRLIRVRRKSASDLREETKTHTQLKTIEEEEPDAAAPTDESIEEDE